MFRRFESSPAVSQDGCCLSTVFVAQRRKDAQLLGVPIDAQPLLLGQHMCVQACEMFSFVSKNSQQCSFIHEFC